MQKSIAVLSEVVRVYELFAKYVFLRHRYPVSHLFRNGLRLGLSLRFITQPFLPCPFPISGVQ